jgi:hypothetical protein
MAKNSAKKAVATKTENSKPKATKAPKAAAPPSVRFSTYVKVPHLDGKGAHGDAHFVSSRHYNLKGKPGSRTSVIRYRQNWFLCTENPKKQGSFVQGGTAQLAQIPAALRPAAK